MKNLFKVFGIIAFAAIIGFGFVACGPGAGGDPDPIALSVIIGATANATTKVTTADTGDTLYAVCATDGVTYQWELNGDNIEDATAASYETDTIGTITVKVSKAKVGNQAYTDATSDTVTVSDPVEE